jgi:peptidoglycan-N-acetylmuramic acid deacetylase
MQKFYRPPQGKFSTSNLQQAQELGYKTIFWSLAYVDWNVKSQPDEQYAIDKLNSRIHPGAVLLLHSTSATNAKILKILIQMWKEQGYVFKSLNEIK